MATINYKEKYEKAVHAAMLAKQDTESVVTIGIIETIFPELKESEGEKIRKDIIWCLKHSGIKENNPINPHVTTITKDAIAWLEKQCGSTEVNPTEFDTRLQNLIGQFDSLPKEELIGSLSFWMNVVQNDGTYKSDEKQGEHDSIEEPNFFDDFRKTDSEVEPNFKIGDKVECIESFDGFIKGHIYTCKEGGWVGCDSQGDWTSKLDKFKAIPSNGGFWEGYNTAKRELGHKPAWSEEDNIILSRIIADYERSNEGWFNAQKSLPHGRKITWLKSLKNRYIPQSKQEWSEKDEHILNNIYDFVAENLLDKNRGVCADECLNWLKSLRPHNTWKPNDEQMEALYEETQKSDRIRDERIVSLYEDLKKLREE